MAKQGGYSPNRIREVREKRGWSEAKLGARCIPTMSATQIDRREKGIVAVTIEDLLSIARALQCHPADLLPLPEIDEGEFALVDRYRGLAEPAREQALDVIDAINKSVRRSA